MKIQLKEISIRDVVEGYFDDGEDGVVAYDEQLDVRPPYQREFVYDDKKKKALIESITKGFPINVMYWFKNDDRYEILDGQQRTISICQYVDGDFALNNKHFHNLTDSEQDAILDYKLLVYICEGTDKQKLDWFETINIAGEKLTKQELRNAVYTGPWLSDAKRHFSKNNGPAYGLGSKLLKGSAIRQDYLETAIKWLNEGDVEGYMADHQHDNNARELWLYFQSVINWVNATFPNYTKEMKGLAWGDFYNSYKDVDVDTEEISQLLADEEVTKKSGVYHYVLSRDSKYLNLRTFTDKQKMEAFKNQDGVCPKTGKKFETYNQMDADHIIPWSKGGKTDMDNLMMVCPVYNRKKGAS